MKTYILSVLAASLLAAVVTVLAPEKGGINKYISFAVSLFVCLILLSPLSGRVTVDTDVLFDLPEEQNTKADDGYGKAKFLSDSAAEAFCISTGTDKQDVRVKATTENGKVVKMEIITKKVPSDKELEKKLSEIFGAEVVIKNEHSGY